MKTCERFGGQGRLAGCRMASQGCWYGRRCQELIQYQRLKNPYALENRIVGNQSTSLRLDSACGLQCVRGSQPMRSPDSGCHVCGLQVWRYPIEVGVRRK